MNASQKKIEELEFTINALDKLLAASEASFLKESKKLKESIQQHEKLESDIEQILDASSDAICVVDKDCNIVYVSKSFNLLYKHSNNIIGKKCYDVTPENECNINDCPLKRILREGRKFSLEKTFKKRDGTESLYKIDIIPYHDYNGDFLGIIKNYRDISEEKLAEKRLHEESLEREMLAEKYRILFEASGDAITIFDEKGFFDCNKRNLELLGYSSKEEFIGKTPIDISTAEQSNGQELLIAYKEHTKKALKEGKDCFEWFCVRKDGTTFPVEVMLSRMEYQGNTVMLSIARDITERKDAEEKIRYISAIQNLILENSTLGISLVRNRIFEWVNPRVGELLMLPVEQIQGASTRVIYPSEESYLKLEKIAYPVLADGERSDNTLQLKRSDGSLFWCRFIGKALDPAKVQDGSIWMFEDITEEKEAHKIAEENAQQQGRIEMANNMLHDIGNAMTGISSYVLKPQMEKAWQEIQSLYQLRDLFMGSENELIKAFGSEKQHALNDFMKALISSCEGRQAKHLEFSEKISSAVGHVCSVLDLQRYYLKENTSPLATKISLPTIISDTLVMLSGSLKKRNVKVNLDVKDKDLNISGDQTRLMRVFLNIIKNSCEAFDEIESIEDGRKLEITIALHKDKEITKIAFADNGIGFTAEDGKRLFERGFTSKINGSGIGLHECRSIIESHGGTINMTSKGINTGVLTIITLPIIK